MELKNETLHNCLKAVESRYPEFIVEIDEDVWGPQRVKLHAQTPSALLDQLESRTPQFLSVKANVECDVDWCKIYVVDLSQERPAFLFRCPR